VGIDLLAIAVFAWHFERSRFTGMLEKK
jgi:hypothetical protein